MAKQFDDDDLEGLEDFDLEDLEEVDGDADALDLDADADGDADADLLDVDDPDADDADELKEIDDDEDVDEIAEPPKPKVTVLTLLLGVLNILAACAFALLLLLDLDTRQTWTWAAFRHHQAVEGLPLKDADKETTPSQAVPDAVQITPDAVKSQYSSKRRGQGISVKEPFQYVDESLNHPPIKPGRLGDATLKTIFKGVGRPVRTLEEEVAYQRSRFLNDVEAAAKEYAQKLAAKKDQATMRSRLSNLLMPLAVTSGQMLALQQQMNATPPAQLNAALEEAGQRKILVDLLRLMQARQPTKADAKVLYEVADRKAWPLKKLQDTVMNRFDLAMAETAPTGEKRLSFERRATIGHLLAALAHLKAPDFTTWLYPDGRSRAVVVLGARDYARAADGLAETFNQYHQDLKERLAQAQRGDQVDVQGNRVLVGGALEKHHYRINSLKDLLARIKSREFDLGRLKAELTKAKNDYAEQKKNHDVVVEQVLKVRQTSAKLAAELRRLEQQIFLAERELANAGQENLRLEQLIREAEKTLVGEPTS